MTTTTTLKLVKPRALAPATYTLPARELRSMLQQVIPFAEHDKWGRPVLKAVCLEFKAGKIAAICTDSHRAAVVTRKARGTAERTAVLPVATIKPLLKTLNHKCDAIIIVYPMQVIIDAGIHVDSITIDMVQEECNVEGTGKWVDKRFGGGYWEVEPQKCMELCKFPNWQRVIPQDNTIRATVNRADLLAVCEANYREWPSMILTCVEGRMAVTGANMDMEAVKSDEPLARFSVEFTGNYQIRFNTLYLRDLLRVLADDTVTLTFHAGSEGRSGNLRPCRVDSAGFRAIVMPMQIC